MVEEKQERCIPCEQALFEITKKRFCVKYGLNDDDCRELLNLVVSEIVKGKSEEEVSKAIKKFIQERKQSQ